MAESFTSSEDCTQCDFSSNSSFSGAPSRRHNSCAETIRWQPENCANCLDLITDIVREPELTHRGRYFAQLRTIIQQLQGNKNAWIYTTHI